MVRENEKNHNHSHVANHSHTVITAISIIKHLFLTPAGINGSGADLYDNFPDDEIQAFSANTFK